MMNVTTKQEILEILKMPEAEFNDTVRKAAKEIYADTGANTIIVTAMLGYDNFCKNQCTYCGMRASNRELKRYRLARDDVRAAVDAVSGLGLSRLFLISGDDPRYSFDDIVAMVAYGREQGIFMTLAAGEMSIDRFRSLADAGLDEYVLKFETSNREIFSKIKPSTTYDARMECIEYIKGSTMKLGSGNIIGLPGQTMEDVAEDILLMKDLEISWAPIVPYMPVPGTPLAREGGRGSLETTMKEISLLRIMMPGVNITAQQPGEDVKNGLGDTRGNLNALQSGANMLFVDMLPVALAQEFNVIKNRNIQGMEKIFTLAELSGMNCH